MALLLTPPLKVRASQIFSRGFIISQKKSKVCSGVLLFFKNRIHFGYLFGPLFESFFSVFPCKTAKIPPKIFARFARMVELFLKFSQFLFHGRVISEILPILEIHGKVDGGVNFISMVMQCTKTQ